MFTSGNLSLLAIAIVIVVIAFVIASGNRTKRIASARPRDVSPEAKKEQEAELRRLLAAGRKIEAIKSYRDFYGVGLKEAKDAVELLEE